MGYKNVSHYPEGKQGWMEAGLPVEKAAKVIANALGGTGSMVHTALTFTSNPSMRNSIPDESEVSVVEYHRARSTLADRLRRKD